MRPRRPYVTTLADVTINRSGESAVITYSDPAVHPMVFAIGPDIDRCSDAEILARFNDSLRAARAQTEGRQHVVVEIPRGHAQLDYFAPAGQWVPRGAVLRCLLDESPKGDLVIYIDDHALSLQEFGGLLRTYTGWGMRIVFVEDDNAAPPLVEIRDLENGEAAQFPRRLTGSPPHLPARRLSHLSPLQPLAGSPASAHDDHHAIARSIHRETTAHHRVTGHLDTGLKQDEGNHQVAACASRRRASSHWGES